MRSFAVSIIAVLSFAAVCDVAYAYDPDVHYCLNYYLAVKIGYTKKQAHQVASAALVVDTDYQTEPLQFVDVPNPNRDVQTPRFRFHAFLDSRTYDQVYKGQIDNGATETEAKRVAEQVCSEDRDRQQRALWLRAGQQGNPGVYLHFLQDIPVHGKYYTRAGHGAAGHWPDFMSYNEDAALQMVRLTVADLKRYMVNYLPQDPVEPNWGEIMKLLGRMIAVNSHYSVENVRLRYSPLGGTPDQNAGCIMVATALNYDDPGPEISYDLSELGDPIGGDWALEGFRPLAGALRVKVLDDTTGAAVSGAKVDLTFQGNETVERSGATEGGIVDFTNVPGESGTFRVRATKDGYQPGETTCRVEVGVPSVATVRLKPSKGEMTPAAGGKVVWFRQSPVVSSNNQANRYPKYMPVTATSCTFTEEIENKKYTNTLTWREPPERLEAGQEFELNMTATANGPGRGVGGWYNLQGVSIVKGLNGAGSPVHWRLPESGGSPHDGTLTLRVKENDTPWVQVSAGNDPAPDTWVVITWEYKLTPDSRSGTGATPAGDAALPTATPFSGTWETVWGDWGDIRLVQEGNRVTGTYGGINGKIDEGTVEGRVLRLKWSDENYGAKFWGGATFTLSDDGNWLIGWRNDWNEPGIYMYRWDARRKGTNTPQPPPAKPPGR